ncbi:MAG: hypothetical protein QNJ65_22220 [Xenococcaceae cyanobacterium MO_234.B1]|nr:hypothetical protein [Xenococcaceae cyanobacterium MO_234.B1]
MIKRLQIPKARVPSYSVIRRVMVKLDYKELERVFNQWNQQYSLIPASEWISVDGKSLKNTVKSWICSKEFISTQNLGFNPFKDTWL